MQGNFSVLYLINDPQGIIFLIRCVKLQNFLSDFAEKLFKKLEGCREKFDVRIMLMNLISRLIGVHQV